MGLFIHQLWMKEKEKGRRTETLRLKEKKPEDESEWERKSDATHFSSRLSQEHHIDGGKESRGGCTVTKKKKTSFQIIPTSTCDMPHQKYCIKTLLSIVLLYCSIRQE